MKKGTSEKNVIMRKTLHLTTLYQEFTVIGYGEKEGQLIGQEASILSHAFYILFILLTIDQNDIKLEKKKTCHSSIAV